MSVRIDVEAILPWDLSLTINGQDYATCRPAWQDVLELQRVTKALESLKDAKPDSEELKGIEDKLRSGLARFFPSPVRRVLNGIPFDSLMAMLAACDAYFNEWFKKKQELARAAALGLAASSSKASPESGPSS